MKRKKTNTHSIHDLAIALCEKRNVWYHSHTVRLVEVEDGTDSCNLCDMDSICDDAMVYLCAACNALLKRPCILKLVTQQR